MPILPAEPDLYPIDLWQGFERNGGDQPESPVVVPAHPASPGEGDGADLRVQKIAFYLPQVVHEDRTPRRKTRSVLPLFTSYLFILADERERVQSMKGNRLVRVIDVADQTGMDHDLRQIHQMLASGLAVVAEPVVPVSSRVRILTGPLTGIEGRVIRRGKRDQFVAVVHFLGSGATVDLEDWQVEQLPDEPD